MRTCLGRSGRRPRSSAPPRRLAPALARLPRPLPARPPGRPPVTGTSGLTVRPPLCRCTSAPTARGSWDWGSCQRELEPTGRALSRWRSGRRSSRRARRASPRAPTRQLPRRPILPSPASCSSRWPRAPQDSMAPSVPDGPSPNPTVAAATAAAAWQNQSVGVLQPWPAAPAGRRLCVTMVLYGLVGRHGKHTKHKQGHTFTSYPSLLTKDSLKVILMRVPRAEAAKRAAPLRSHPLESLATRGGRAHRWRFAQARLAEHVAARMQQDACCGGLAHRARLRHSEDLVDAVVRAGRAIPLHEAQHGSQIWACRCLPSGHVTRGRCCWLCWCLPGMALAMLRMPHEPHAQP
jgi:hypothetical protein